MKRATVALLMIVAILISSSAGAEGRTWDGTQMRIVVNGELRLNKWTGLRGHATTFLVPQKNAVMSIFYAGPTFSFSSHVDQVDEDEEPEIPWFNIWISPQLTGWMGWFEDSDGFGPSLWINMSFWEGKISTLIEGETVFSSLTDEMVYYGYYCVDGHLLKDRRFNIGFQVEQVDALLMYGPHAGLKKGSLHIEFQYYRWGDDRTREDTHTLAILTALSF